MSQGAFTTAGQPGELVGTEERHQELSSAPVRSNRSAGLHSDFLDLFASNGLATPNTLKVLGTPVDLSAVTCDAYVLAGATDHIIPWPACYRTTQLLGGKSQFVLNSSGHVQTIVNPPGNKKAFYLTGGGAETSDHEAWKAHATKHDGTWWDHWLAWLGKRSGSRRPAPETPGNDRHHALEPAPGRYVHR
jgi:polyhydroxyalkanoate synthase